MAKELLGEIYKGFRDIIGTGSVFVLFAAAVLAFYLLFSKKTKGSAAVCLSVLGAISSAAARVVEKAVSYKHEKTAVKFCVVAFTVILCFFAVISSGRKVYEEGDLTVAENAMHIPDDIAGAAAYISSVPDEPKVLVMPGWGPYFESYSRRYRMAYDEPQNGDLSHLDEDEWTMYTQLSTVHPDMKKVSSAALRSGCEYVVLSDEIWPDVDITRCGYELVHELGSCSVYRKVESF